MINPVVWLRDFLEDLEQNIEGINSHKMAVDSSMVTKHLNAHLCDDNYMALGILPDLNSKGETADNYQQVTATQLMILYKTTYSAVDYDELYEIFEQAYDVAKLVLDKMLLDSTTGCNNFRFLNVKSIQVIPVWNLASCNGCNILFSFDS